MISIRDSIGDLERCHQDRTLAIDCYVAAINNLADYTIELEPNVTESQRKYLSALAEDVASGKREVLSESQATLRALLRDYRDRSTDYVRNLRAELEGTVGALEQILGSLAQTDGDHQSRLRAALAKLRDLTCTPAGSAVGPTIISAVDVIDQSLEQIRKDHQLTVSQLRVEMGMLHKRIDGLEAAATLDQVTEFYNRREMEQRIHSCSGQFTLLLVRANGFRLAELQFKPEVAVQLTASFTKRLRHSLPASAVIARWSNEDFVVMLSIPPLEANPVAKSIGKELSGSYACLLAGKTVRPTLQLSVAVVDGAGVPPARILERVNGFLTGI